MVVILSAMVFWIPMVASLNLHPGVLSKKSTTLLHRFVWVLVKVCGIIALGVLELLNSIFQAMGIWQISMANIVINRLCLMGLMFVMVRIFHASGVIASQPIIENIAAVIMAVFYVSMIRRDTRTAK